MPKASITAHVTGVGKQSQASSFQRVISPSFRVNFQNPPLLGISKALHLSLPVVSNAASLEKSVCNISRVSAPAHSAAWLLPSASDSSFQPLMGGASLYQHAISAVWSGETVQSQIFTSGASNPGVFEWVLTGGPEQKFISLSDYNVTLANHNNAVFFISMASKYHNTSDANNMASLYPLLSASLVQGAPSQNPNQGHSLSLPYQEGSQVYYYNQGPLLYGEHGPYLQSYGSVTDTESRVSASQLEVVEVLKEVQPTNVIPPASTSGIFLSVSAYPITKTSFQAGKNKHTDSEPISGAPEAKSKPEIPDWVFVGELLPGHGGATDSAPANMAKHSNSKPPKATSGKTSKTNSHGLEKTKRTNENNSNKAKEHSLSQNQISTGEKPTIPKIKRPKNQLELTQEPFKKLRSCLGRHMLESVKVFHPLGNKLPPPGKIKLVPFHFPTSDKPAAQPVTLRPPSLSSHRPACPARATRPIPTKPDKPVFTNSAQASDHQSAVSRPVPYETSSCAPFQREPVCTALTTPWRPPKPLSNLLQDFAVQQIPWRKPDISGPVMSIITKEQRPEREAMKRKAQLERENATKNTSLGKVQYFIEKKKEIEISQYYGYAS
ncbi:LOW QUALITY PROTEIN: uncharacterized protein C2orf78-like [Molossus nigricans]